jgi:general secretion pathway protein G
MDKGVNMTQTRTLFKTTARAARRGLTLIEIMVVIALLGVLGTVIVVNLMGTLDDGKAEATKVQMANIDSALMQYAIMNGSKYPTTSDGLEKAKKKFKDHKIPTDPWGNAYIYRSPATHGSGKYELVSLGADGKEGGEDANADIKSWEL